jgi:NitT/TauT family transport system substrate-binding protein
MNHQIAVQEPFRALFYAPFYAALARGDYAAQGVDVRLLPGTVPSLAKDSVLDGTADLAWGGPMRLLLAHDKDPDCPLKLFGAVVMGDPFFLVGRTARPDFRLTDLATLTLGTVSEVPTPWWCLQDDIRRAGLDPDAVRRVTNRSMAENAAAVAAGTLDVAQLFEPIVSAMEIAGTGHAWHAQASRGPTSYTAFYSRADVIATKRPAFEAMVRGLAVTLAWFATATRATSSRPSRPFSMGSMRQRRCARSNAIAPSVSGRPPHVSRPPRWNGWKRRCCRPARSAARRAMRDWSRRR